MAAERAPSPYRRIRDRWGSVRMRTTIGAVVIVGLALALGAVALVVVMRATLLEQVEDSARARAGQIADAVEAGQPLRLDVGADDESFAQVLGSSGKIVAASDNVAGMAAFELAPGESARMTSVLDEELIAVASAADGGVVVVAQSVDDVTESTRLVAQLLGVGLPVMLALVAVTTWQAAGRALSPVDAIRSEVDAISAAELYRRVPDPPSSDEISRLAETMNRMLARLEQAQERQREFISDASHELRSPVASIRQHVEVALAHPDRTTVPELAGTVLAEDLRVQRMVEDLLLLARADEHQLQLAARAVDLDDLVLDEARRLRESTSLRIDTRGVSAGRVVGDAAGLQRVLRNLGENASRHARGLVAFSLDDRNGAVTLAVDDDGPGIAPADRRRVLERFVRLDEARARDAGGAGLGLAIVDELVAAHDGNVVVTGSPMGGARFEVRLPSRS